MMKGSYHLTALTPDKHVRGRFHRSLPVADRLCYIVTFAIVDDTYSRGNNMKHTAYTRVTTDSEMPGGAVHLDSKLPSDPLQPSLADYSPSCQVLKANMILQPSSRG